MAYETHGGHFGFAEQGAGGEAGCEGSLDK